MDLVDLADRILRRNPKHLKFLAPVITYLMTLMAALLEYGHGRASRRVEGPLTRGGETRKRTPDPRWVGVWCH